MQISDGRRNVGVSFDPRMWISPQSIGEEYASKITYEATRKKTLGGIPG